MQVLSRYLSNNFLDKDLKQHFYKVSRGEGPLKFQVGPGPGPDQKGVAPGGPGPGPETAPAIYSRIMTFLASDKQV